MTELDKKFEKAYAIASAMTEKLPADVMLQFYAYYKQATYGMPSLMPTGDNEVRNAFKLNAWLQVNHLSEEEAKLKYIELVEQYNNLKIE